MFYDLLDSDKAVTELHHDSVNARRDGRSAVREMRTMAGECLRSRLLCNIDDIRSEKTKSGEFAAVTLLSMS